ncbi:M16 family metallopeptidase [Tepidibacter aestuarii]|uniref:M16 family metallopeptidase n=1 Tax=Tepidibacter aestuarii TaxID=2925782 RepID=UPI0020BF32B7|nr:pitrilysin family protein [Tepidibacter aestuarii]CAH2213970.1 zinc protease [Tepidibacter aestuarii]
MSKKCTLDNGLVIVGEEINHVNSVSFGIWIGAGSRYEDEHTNGMSHFIEHMLFKGTKNRTAKKIAQEVDSLGGQINAFTSKETTCYYVKMLDEHIESGINILSDMILNPLFLDQDISKEKSVVLEEISMYEDSPEDLAHDMLFEMIYKNQGIGRNILGTRTSLQKIKREDMIEFFNNYYVPSNCVISISGNFDFDKMVEIIQRKFKGWNNKKDKNININNCNFNLGITTKNKDIEQMNLCMGLEGIGLESEDIYALSIVNNIFGSSMSSRLFQNIREEQGTVYSIYSYLTMNKGLGVFNIASSMSEKNIYKVYNSIVNEIKSIRQNSLTKEEIKRSKEQLKGNYILSLESTSSRMMSMGKSQILLNKINNPKDIINKINNVADGEIDNIIKEIFDIDKIAISVVGKNSENLSF